MQKKHTILLLIISSLLLSLDIESYEPLQVTTESSKESSVVVKNAKEIYFASDRSGNFDVYKKDLATEKVTRITFQPSNEYPAFYGKKLLMISDETDVYGNIYSLKENGTQEIVYLSVGSERNPFIKDNRIYFTSDGKLGKIVTSDKIPEYTGPGIGDKAMFLPDGKLIYQTPGDIYGFNNLFAAPVKDNILSEPVQVTYGSRIMTGFDIAPDGLFIIFSAVSADTNGDGKLDAKDNSVLYRIDREGEYFTDPIQLTPESYSSREPALSPDGKIYFISDKMGSDDIWSCGKDGIIPDLNDFTAQAELSEQLFEEYRAQDMLSAVTGTEEYEKNSGLLTGALLSYNRSISFAGGSEEERAKVYFRIAEIDMIQKKYSQAESIYRILISRYGNNERVSAEAEVLRIESEIRRKNISADVYGYEIDEYIRYLNALAVRYKDPVAVNTVLVKTGGIYNSLGRYTTAGSFFLRAGTNKNGNENPGAYYGLALSNLGDGNEKASVRHLVTAVKSAYGPDQKESYISEYFKFSGTIDGYDERIYGIMTDETLPPEIRSYAGMKAGDTATDLAGKTSAYGEVKKYFVADPENITLKRYSAQADYKLSEKLTAEGFQDEAEGLLKYMKENYRGFDYDQYSAVAGRRLSSIYLRRAEQYRDQNRYDNALLTYTVAFGLDKRDPEVIRGIADCYLKLNKTDEAVSFFQKEYAAAPNDPYINYALGYCYSLRGTTGRTAGKRDMTAAVNYLNRSLELDGNLKYSYLTLSYCYEALYHIRLKEAEDQTDRNILLKGFDFLTGPFKFLLETVNIIEDSDLDYTDMAVSLLGRGISLCGGAQDKDLRLKMKLNLANNYYNMGEYARKQALTNYIELLSEGYEFSSEKQEALINERIGHCMFTIGDASAGEYYDKALDIYKKINDRNGELRVSMRTALLYLTTEDKEGDVIGGDDAFRKYSEIILKLRSEDNTEAVNLIKRNSAFAKLTDQEYFSSAGIIDEMISEGTEPGKTASASNMIVLNLLGLDIPVWKLDLVLGSMYSEGFEGRDEMALLYSMQASNYQNVKDYEKVKKFLNEKAEVFRKKDNRLALSLIENRLGVIEYSEKNWNESIKHFGNSNKLCIELELFSSALKNENNIMKSMMHLQGQSLPDTTVYSLARGTAEALSKAENLNLKGVLSYQTYNRMSYGEPSDKYQAFRYLISTREFFLSADSLILGIARTTEQKNRMQAAVLYNLSMTEYETGNAEIAQEVFLKGKAAAELTQDKLLKWRYLLRSGDIEQDGKAKLEYWLEAEKLLSEYLPSTADYELITGWRDDIRPLYDRIISSYADSGEPEKAMNYAERYKSRTILNYYSSRYLDYREQLHKIHIKKIRYNNDEIVRYRHRAEVMRNKNPEKYAKTIAEYEKQADFYENELTEIYDQIKRSSDERLLQFVSIDDIDTEALSDILGEYKAVLSIYSLTDRDLYFYRDYKGVRFFSTEPGEVMPFNQISEELEDIEHLFVIQDGVNDINYSGAPEHLVVTLLPTIQSMKTVTENANINYSELKKASEYTVAGNEISAAFENGGIIYFDIPAVTDGVNVLETSFLFGGNRIRVSDFLKYKIPAYAVLISDAVISSDPAGAVITANSLIFAGAQTVIMPAQEQDDSCMKVLAEKLKEEAPEKDITSVIRENGIKCTIYGLSGMDRDAQREFATVNLRSSLVNGVRYFNSRVYEKAAVHFIQALAMARNTGDKQELNILKTLISSLSKMKDYRRAVSYGLELIAYAEKNSLENELLQAYDSVSKDHFRNKEYDKSIEYQNKILNFPGVSEKEILSVYDMLSVIYSYSGDYLKSIAFKKKYLERSGMTEPDDINLFSTEAGGKEAELLFNSLRNIMVSYYRAGETDSALYVYDSINNNLDIFEDVSGEAFGGLLESAGLCYMKKSLYKKAEEQYIEALDYFRNEEQKVSLYIDLADLYYYTDKLSSAVKYLEMAEAGNPGDPEKMRIYNTRSLVEVKLNDLPAAISYSYKALEKTIETADVSGEATARVNLAKIMILDDDISGAVRNLQKSIELSRKSGNIRAEASANFYKGEIFLNTADKPDSSLYYYGTCATLSVLSEDDYFLSRACYGKGISYLALNKADSSEVYLISSLSLSGRLGFNDVYLSSAYALSGIYEDKQTYKATDMLDQLTARSGELLVSGENQLPSDQLSVIMSGYERKIHLLLGNGKTEEALSAIRERDGFYSMNDLKHFSGNKSENEKNKTVASDDIKKELNDGMAFLLILPYGNSVYMVVITKNNMLMNRSALPKETEEMVSRIRSKSDFTGPSKKVYETMFSKDVQDVLSGINDIVIYSYGSMKNFPFDALYDGKEYLIDKYNITETDRIGFKESGQAAVQSISFSDPFTAESELVFAKREAVALSEAFRNTTPVSGMEATESLLRSPMMEDYSMIHLPVHSFIMSRDSLAASGRTSYIQLSADDYNDGRLEWNEIVSGSYKGKQVILSGCDTGGGSGQEYYSSFDLTGAFLESGARSVISSKWRTDDLAASVLMKRYFRYLATGQNEAEALSQAKRDVRAYLNPHPYFWANFKLSIR